MRIGRLARTIASLHPLQLAFRPVRWVGSRAIHAVPATGAPPLRELSSTPPSPLVDLFESERERHHGRSGRLPRGSLLEAYERAYGFEVELDESGQTKRWQSAVALHPYPASVRARRLAVASRLGRQGLGPELARASRAVAAQPEVHLLGNHLLENGLGLVCAGAVAHGLEADLWWAVGSRLLAWQLPVQFLRDGGHFERSASYHLALVAALLEAIELADAGGRGAPALWLGVARRAVAWLERVRAPDASYPLFNDAMLDAAPPIDEVFALAAALGLRNPERPLRAPAVDVLTDTGWVVAAAPDGATLIVDAGPDGASHQPGHVHADALSFELWVNGQRTVVDYGVESYLNDAARARTRATRSHSTVELGGGDSCEVWSAFRVGRRQRARVHLAEVNGDAGRIQVSHDGYRHLSGAPIHHRELNLAAGRLKVVDRVTSSPVSGTSRLRLDADAARGVRITGSGRIDRVDDVWHPRYGEARPAVVFSQPVRVGQISEFLIEWESPARCP